MLRNNFKVAVRTLVRHPVYSSINLFGLATGLACSLLILTYSAGEYGVNHHFDKADRIFRINRVLLDQGGEGTFISPGPFSVAARADLPGVADAFRYTAIDIDLHTSEAPFRSTVMIAEPTFFSVLDFDVVVGNPEEALQQPGTIVLTDAEAARLFGTKEALDREVEIATWNGEGNRTYRVGAVVERPPFNSVTSINGKEWSIWTGFVNAGDFFANSDFDSDWNTLNTINFVELEQGVQPEVVQAALPSLLASRNADFDASSERYELAPITSTYLDDFGGAAGRLARLLLIVAFIILGLAGFNYVAISTALAVSRSREVGVRKALGASRGELMRQYIGESVMVSVAAMILALLLSWFGLGLFNSLIGRPMAFSQLSGSFAVLAVGLTLSVGVAGGLYPALVLSRMRPALVIKSNSGSGMGRSLVRKLIITTQFCVAIGLLIAAVTVNRQAVFVAEQDLGFTSEPVLAISSLPREWTLQGVERMEAVREEMSRVTGVESVSLAWGPPGPRFTGMSWDLRAPGAAVDEDAVSVPISQVDARFLETMDIELVAGEFFPIETPFGEPSLVLNETAARSFGEHGVAGGYVLMNDVQWRIAGIIVDYKTRGLDLDAGPLALVDVRQSPFYRDLLLRVSRQDPAAAFEHVQSTWARLFPDVAFETYFLDEQWYEHHEWIWRTRRVANLATLLAVLVACLGLLGIVSISAGLRRREVGVRKVIGASVPSLVRLLLKEYLALVVAASLIAAPIAYVVMQRWLDDFVVRVSMNVVTFGIAVGMVLLLAIATAGSLCVRAAMANPVEVLKDE